MKPHPHESAKAHVTGKALYVDDVALPSDCLYVVAGVSEHPKAGLLSVDLQGVSSSPGVVDVLTAADIPGENEVGAVLPGDTLLADQHVEYVAQPIFAVAATSLKAAQRAVQKAQIQYDIESPTLSVAEAMAAQAMVSPTRRWGNEQIAEQLAQAHYYVDQDLYIRGQEHFYL